MGEWQTTLSDAWFLEPPGTTVPGETSIQWIGESMLLVHTTFGGGRTSIPSCGTSSGAATRTTGSSRSTRTTGACAASSP